MRASDLLEAALEPVDLICGFLAEVKKILEDRGIDVEIPKDIRSVLGKKRSGIEVMTHLRSSIGTRTAAQSAGPAAIAYWSIYVGWDESQPFFVLDDGGNSRHTIGSIDPSDAAREIVSVVRSWNQPLELMMRIRAWVASLGADPDGDHNNLSWRVGPVYVNFHSSDSFEAKASIVGDRVSYAREFKPTARSAPAVIRWIKEFGAKGFDKAMADAVSKRRFFE
jgi:hypothetical protein